MSLELSWGRAANSLNYELQQESCSKARTRPSRSCRCSTRTRSQGDYVPWFQFRGGRTGNAGQYQTDRGPFTNKNVTHDVVANLTKVCGLARAEGRLLLPEQLQAAEHLRQLQRRHQLRRQRQQPVRHRLQLRERGDRRVQHLHAGARSSRIPEWRYHNFEFYAQDNWKAGNKLTLDYGVRFYYLTPQWDETLQASNFLPTSSIAATRPRLYTPVCIGASPCAGANRRGMDPRSSRRADADAGQHRRCAVHRPPDAGLEPLQRLVPGRPGHQRPAAGRQRVQGLAARRRRLRPHAARARPIFRGGWGIFYDRPQGNMVFDMITNAPGVLNSSLAVGPAAGSHAPARQRAEPDAGLNPTAYDFEPPKVDAVERRPPEASCSATSCSTWPTSAPSRTTCCARCRSTRCRVGATFLPQNQDPTRAASAMPGVDGAADRPAAALPGLRRHPDVGLQRLRQLPLAADGRQPPVRQRLHVLVLLRVEQGAGHQQRRLHGRPAERDATPRPVASTTACPSYDRPHNFVTNFIYQLPSEGQRHGARLLIDDWQLSGVYRWTSGTPVSVGYSIPGIGNANLTGSATATRARASC